MSVKIEEIEQYYDLPIEEEELSQAFIHYFVIKTLSATLENLYADSPTKVMSSINIYYPGQAAVSPDVAIVDGLVTSHRSAKGRGSYYVTNDSPPPRVAFEIASDETWSRDLDQKLGRYERLGTKEYFVFDPNNPQVWSAEWRKKGRLVGWELNPLTKLYTPLKLAADGRMLSKELDCWLTIELLEDDPYLRLYDRSNRRLLTTDEAKDQAIREARRAKRLVQRAETMLQAERKQAEAMLQAERQRAEAERKRIAELEELLRQLQQKPDDIQ